MDYLHSSNEAEPMLQTRIPSPDSPAKPRVQAEDDTECVTISPLGDPTHGYKIPQSVAWRLYLSHLLSTWNSRSFEFGSVLFLAAIYPDTLFYLSTYAIVRSIAAILLSAQVGSVIDRCARLSVVQGSIVCGRISVVVSAICFWLLCHHTSLPIWTRNLLFAVLIILGCLEKLAATANLVSVERDWAIVIAHDDHIALQELNARMRRIDLGCKLAGPLYISLVDGISTNVAILMTLAVNLFSLPVEYLCIAGVYDSDPQLASSRVTTEQHMQDSTVLQKLKQYFSHTYAALDFYFRHPACQPSFALSLLYLTVLSFSGQMVTYLATAGLSPIHIGIARSISTLFELSATWLAPSLMRHISPSRAGMWCLSWQNGWLMATTLAFWNLPAAMPAAIVLFAGTAISRLGLWGYDLCAQTMIQTAVRDDARGSFSTTEALLQNAFELVSFALTLALPRPDQFRYPVLVSAGATFCAVAVYARYLRKLRGHLVHLPCKGVI